MLTLEVLKKAARLQSSYGEIRPGYITHDDKNLKGPSSIRSLPEQSGKPAKAPLIENVSEEKVKKRQFVRICVTIESDPETGEYRMMVK